MKNTFKLLILISLILALSISCSMLSEKVGVMASMHDGILTEIESNVYGIEGTVYPIGAAFYSGKSVKYKLDDRSAKILLETKKSGDKIGRFLFEFDEVNKSDDWSTVIHISSF